MSKQCASVNIEFKTLQFVAPNHFLAVHIGTLLYLFCHYIIRPTLI